MSFEFESVNHFFQEVSQDPELQLQFQSVTDRESLVDKAVALGKEKSYNFSSTEVSEWLESMTPQHQSQSDTSGELSDSELEAVAGAGPVGGAIGAAGGAIAGFFSALVTGKFDEIGEKMLEGAVAGGVAGLLTPGA
ncbi:Nif11-like leader peptide family natural product precursor [Microcoleus sp. D3_18a_C4]|uniref:Nif11-like leader peptide family natural product precursor n=1 Tax=unclassified Microcoleus TaxID=2642155 RepID=UPI002FD4337E